MVLKDIFRILVYRIFDFEGYCQTSMIQFFKENSYLFSKINVWQGPPYVSGCCSVLKNTYSDLF